MSPLLALSAMSIVTAFADQGHAHGAPIKAG
jgi:hypothetical protein